MLTYQSCDLMYFKRNKDLWRRMDHFEIYFVTIVLRIVAARKIKSGENDICRLLNKVMDRCSVESIVVE